MSDSSQKIYGVDWGHKTKKVAVYGQDGIVEGAIEYNEEKGNYVSSLEEGSIIATENMPHKYKAQLTSTGLEIWQCGTHLTKLAREKDGIEKTDENDAKILYDSFVGFRSNGNQEDETFRLFIYDAELEALMRKVDIRSMHVNSRKYIKQLIAHADEKVQEHLSDQLKAAKTAVNKCDTVIGHSLKQFAIWENYLKDINGIGKPSAAELIAIIKDIKRFPTVSKLWAYFGLHVINGSAPKRKAGQVANWNGRAKSLVLNDIVSNGFKLNGAERVDKETGEVTKEAAYWRCVYDSYKEAELEKNEMRPEDEKLSKGHTDKRAMRKTGKEFLKRLWIKWNELEEAESING